MSAKCAAGGLSWPALPIAARAFAAVVIAAGFILAATFLPQRIDQPFLFVVLLALACLTSSWKVNLCTVALGACIRKQTVSLLWTMTFSGGPWPRRVTFLSRTRLSS